MFARMEAAARRGGREASLIETVAVAKRASAQALVEISRSGRIRHIGENRVQDARLRKERVSSAGAVPGVCWRMIGHLQTNKVPQALGLFDALDSLDSLRLADELDRTLSDSGRTLPVLIQVKLTGRPTQSGVDPESLGEFLEACRRRPRLEIRGLMAIAPMTEPVENARPYFKLMKSLFDGFFPEPRTNEPGSRMYLSMGMSRDFDIAIEEGANMVRLGTALFGGESQGISEPAMRGKE